MPHVKVNGYAHPRTTPGSRVDERRRRAEALRQSRATRTDLEQSALEAARRHRAHRGESW